MRRRTAAISSGCRAARSSSRPSAAIAGCDAADRIENCARACSTSSSVAASIVRSRSSAAARNASVSASRIRRTSSASCCSSATMSLLISTVLSGSRNRLAPLPELPCTMPGIAVAVFRAHHQHVAAVAIGHDLLLQILRRVLAAQVRFERSAQPRPLLAQPIANAPQLRARIVHHLAGRDRSCGGRRRSRARTTPAPSAIAPQDRKRRARAPDAARTVARPMRESRRARAAAAASSARPSTAERRRGSLRDPPAPQRDLLSGEKAHGLGRRRQRGGDRARLVERLQPRQPRAPGGVCAKRRTASTIRSNSRALRAPACMVIRSD